jgi:hypothetical protein
MNKPLLAGFFGGLAGVNDLKSAQTSSRHYFVSANSWFSSKFNMLMALNPVNTDLPPLEKTEIHPSFWKVFRQKVEA